jgi:hypothetical protein
MPFIVRTDNQIGKLNFLPYNIAMARRGRPRKAKGDISGVRIELRCKKAEKKLFIAAAKAAGMPLSEWIRNALVAQANFTIPHTYGSKP